LKINQIYLYDEPTVPELKINQLAEFLQNKFHLKVNIRKNIFKYSKETTPREIASCRIFNTKRPYQPHEPSEEEILFEKRSANEADTNIIMYDGFEFLRAITNLIPANELTLENFHVVFTHKLMCTYDDGDYRYHGRALIGSNPSIISTTGIIEAPAKPREYYLEIFSRFNEGLNLESLKKKYQGTYLEYGDKRLGVIAEGYLLQALFYYITGEPFCNTLECRLHNAHWQKDLLYSQIEIGKLCNKHQKVLNELLNN
jgi:hypothetical protein